MASTFQIHPLVVMCIGDHYVRQNAGKETPQAVVGALVGVKGEGHATLPMVKPIKGQLDRKGLDEDISLYKELKPTHSILGWYSTEVVPSEQHAKFTAQFTKYTPNPLYLTLDPSIQAGAKALPIRVYTLKGNSLSPTPWALKSDESERVCVDYAVQEQDNLQSAEQGQSIVVTKISQLKQAIKDMMSRVALLRRYLEDIQKGKVEPSQDILREVKTLCNRLPIFDNPDDFKEQYAGTKYDGKLLGYCGTLTVAVKNLRRVMDSYGQNMESNRGMGGMGGLAQGMGEPMMGSILDAFGGRPF